MKTKNLYDNQIGSFDTKSRKAKKKMAQSMVNHPQRENGSALWPERKNRNKHALRSKSAGTDPAPLAPSMTPKGSFARPSSGRLRTNRAAPPLPRLLPALDPDPVASSVGVCGRLGTVSSTEPGEALFDGAFCSFWASVAFVGGAAAAETLTTRVLAPAALSDAVYTGGSSSTPAASSPPGGGARIASRSTTVSTSSCRARGYTGGGVVGRGAASGASNATSGPTGAGVIERSGVVATRGRMRLDLEGDAGAEPARDCGREAGVAGRDGEPNQDRLGFGTTIAEVEADAGGGVGARECNLGETGVEMELVAPWGTPDEMGCDDGVVEAALDGEEAGERDDGGEPGFDSRIEGRQCSRAILGP